MNKLATILLCINFITVLFPQPGYIHPDEFFQSSEIVAGDILGVKHSRPWEFSSSDPVRSIVFPYLLCGPPISLLSALNSSGLAGLQVTAVKVVMATRLPLAFLSTFGYLATARVAEFCGAETYLSSVLWCSSYVTWVYFTRTFSNTIEAVMLAVLLIVVLSALSCLRALATLRREKGKSTKGSSRGTNTGKNSSSQKVESSTNSTPDDQDSSSNATGSQSDGGRSVDKPLTEEKNTDDDSGSMNVNETQTSKGPDESAEWAKQAEIEQFHGKLVRFTSFWVGVLVTAGFFNRPTFLLFALTPTLLWFYVSRRGGLFSNIVPLVYAGFGCVTIFSTFILIDTAYFNPAFFDKILENISAMNFEGLYRLLSTEGISEFVVTPWNFVQYNMRTENLREHGLHPRYTHTLVNLSLLLGPLVVPFAITCISALFQLLKCMFRSDNGQASTSKTSHVPTVWLTLMALVPVAGLSVFPHQEPRFLIPLMPVLVVLGSKLVSKTSHARLSFFAVWTVFNVLLTLGYGYMHQAAIIPALSIYQQKLSASRDNLGSHHAIFYKTYPPPQHILLIKEQSQQVDILDLGGAALESLVLAVKDRKASCDKRDGACNIYVFLPSTVSLKVHQALGADQVKSTTSICPHLSMEAPPRLAAWWKGRIALDELLMDFCLNVFKLT